MAGFDWKKTVATVAPSLATALGGPLAGTAVTALTKAVFGEATTDTGKLQDALTAPTPEVLAKIKVAELEFQKDMAALEVDLERIAASDRASARDRQAAVKDRVPSILAGVILVGFFAILAAMFFGSPPEQSKEALYILIGYLGAMATSVSTYFFGSSAGSAEKTRLLAKEASK